MLPETALYIVNNILSRTSRSPLYKKEELSLYDRTPRYRNRFLSTTLGLNNYWQSSQRYHPVRMTYWDTHRRLMSSPRHAGSLDMDSTYLPGYYFLRPNFVPARSLYKKEEPSLYDKKRIQTKSFLSSPLGLRDYWVSPQRCYPIGTVSRNTRRQLMVLPGNTGVLDLESIHIPGYCRLKPSLIWKHRWQKLNDQHLKRKVYR
ncbi:uncharacterized protein LOC102356998 [Latimeria chalumnae]|uniref:uncharacterized protein LOC102356998 n=1 Tax=Latimeria chalumnae TaxID=7897 RepID=UPI0003C19EFF|nr:PREDICTED: uncharacterized protein LOC102356998 [Latimeria chalumnae]|eukprot:XP_005995648.1 PREDICTED: uncharacterized protein LOC102356998 [Latimeria chalumnae]